MPASFVRDGARREQTENVSRVTSVESPAKSESRKRAATKAQIESPAGTSHDSHRTLIDALVTSKIYQDYEHAFTEATGLPVALRPVESWQLPHHGHRGESPFCAMVAGKSKSCAVCLQLQEKLVDAAMEAPATIACEAGMCDTAVPVKQIGRAHV